MQSVARFYFLSNIVELENAIDDLFAETRAKLDRIRFYEQDRRTYANFERATMRQLVEQHCYRMNQRARNIIYQAENGKQSEALINQFARSARQQTVDLDARINAFHRIYAHPEIGPPEGAELNDAFMDAEQPQGLLEDNQG